MINQYDVFSNFGIGRTDSFGGTYIGVVKKYDSSTKSCMVLIPEIANDELLGPFRTMRPFMSAGSFVAPSVDDKVVVAFLDENLENAVLLGVLHS